MQKTPAGFVGELRQWVLPVYAPAPGVFHEQGHEMWIAHEKGGIRPGADSFVVFEPRSIDRVYSRSAPLRFGDNVLQAEREIGTLARPSQREAARKQDDILRVVPLVRRRRV
jgi:hypothetical protein